MPPTPRRSTVDAFREGLRALMVRSGWTQRDLAKRSRVSQKQISNILNNVNSPSLETADKLARAFGLSAWQLQIVAPQDLSPEDFAKLEAIVDGFLEGSARDRAIMQTIADTTGKFRLLDG
jgi:transcriptional regulator with XRE-family HTH domain